MIPLGLCGREQGEFEAANPVVSFGGSFPAACGILKRYRTGNRRFACEASQYLIRLRWGSLFLSVSLTWTGEPIRTDIVRYGYRGTVLLIPAHERMRTERGIATFGPRYFGYDREYIPVERLMENTSG